MPIIVEINNPFEPHRERVHQVEEGTTFGDWLRKQYPDWVRWESPTIVTIGGQGLLIPEYNLYKLKKDDVLNVVRLQGWAAVPYLLALLVVSSVVIALNMPKASTPGEETQPDPTYDLKGQVNQNRFSNPIECAYGRNRIFPSIAARPYNKFKNNDQYLYQLLCLGHGEFDVEAIQIEDTPIANFPDVQYELYNPGDSVDLFPDNVITSVEVNGIELKGTNEDGYEMSGPFVVNPSGTDTDHIELDVVFPGGLYKMNDKGSFESLNVTALFEKREIDDSGTPIGGWTTLASFSKTLRTNTAQRFTLEANVTPGRYEVRGQRTNAKDESSRTQSLLRWEGLRAFLPSTKDYGAVTLLAIAARASNNLNDRSSARVNVIATRKLPTYDEIEEEWTAPVATRNPIWALFDAGRATYGAAMEDMYFDLDELLTLATAAATAEINFDFVFEQRISVWEAFKTILRVLRAVPMLNGSELTAIRDVPQTVPKAAFNKEQIVAGTFQYQVKLSEPGEYDGLEVSYIDQTTWTKETVLCLVDGELGDRPEKMELFGCTSRTLAYREGMYMRRCKLKLREQVKFSTGLEGHIPPWNSAIFVTHDVPSSWGQGGLLLDIADDDVTCTLNEPVDFSAGGTHKIAFRKKDGTVVAPITCTAGSTPYEVVLASALTPADFEFDAQREPPGFYFGPAGEEAKFCKITNLIPDTNGVVAVQAVVYEDVFVSDTEEPPALPDVPMPPGPPAAPILDCSSVKIFPVYDNERRALVSWSTALGATSYRVEYSNNGTDWFLAGTTVDLSMQIPVEPGEMMYARVQPVGAAAGDWCDAADNTEVAPELPLEGPEYYPNRFDILQYIPATLDVYCKARGGTATVAGFAEFTDVSTPKRYYLETKQSGSQVICDYLSPGDTGCVEDDCEDLIGKKIWLQASWGCGSSPIRPLTVMMEGIITGIVDNGDGTVDASWSCTITRSGTDDFHAEAWFFRANPFGSPYDIYTNTPGTYTGTRTIPNGSDIRFGLLLTVNSAGCGWPGSPPVAGGGDLGGTASQYGSIRGITSENHYVCVPSSESVRYVAKGSAIIDPDVDVDEATTDDREKETITLSTGCNPPMSGGSSTSSTDPFISGTGSGKVTAVVTTRTTKTQTSTDACVSDQRVTHSDMKVELLQEDTDDNAIARLMAGEPDWSELEWGEPMLMPPAGNLFTEDGCPCEHSGRGYGAYNGRTLTYLQKRMKIAVTGMNASGAYKCRVFLHGRYLPDNTVHADVKILTFTTYADGLGDTEFEFDMPMREYWRYWVSAIKFYTILE